MTDAAFEERLALIHAAYAAGDPAARPVLERALAGDDDRLADPAAIPALVPVLDDMRPYEPWGTSPERGGVPLRDRVADVIDELAGEPLGGDPERIRAWLAARAG